MKMGLLDNIKPNVINEEEKTSILIYGDKKIGKTTFCAGDPSVRDKTLILATEAGYKHLHGVKAININDWNTFQQVLKELLKDAERVRKGQQESLKFTRIAIDTCDLLWTYCVDFVCQLNNCQDLSETENKKGYKQVESIFEKAILSLLKATAKDNEIAYEVTLVSHCTYVTEKHPITKTKTTTLLPTLEKRCLKVVNRAVDVCMLVQTVTMDDGTEKRMAYFRSNGLFEAGSRMPYLIPACEFTYQNVREAFKNAIRKQIEVENIVPSSGSQSIMEDAPTYDFEVEMNKARQLYHVFETAGKVMDFVSITESFLGTGVKISEATPKQAPVIYAINIDLQEKATELGLI